MKKGSKNNRHPDEHVEKWIIKELPYTFEKELINRQNKFIRPYKEFAPVVPPIIKCDNFNKFYANQDRYKIPQNVMTKHISFIENYNKHNEEAISLLGNKIYGWFSLHVHGNVQTMNLLNKMWAPKRRCFLTIFNEQLHKENATERDPFNGLRFIVY